MQQPTVPAAPMQRADPPEGYREAVAAHRATWSTTRQHTRPEIQAAAERQCVNGSGSRRRTSPTAARPSMSSARKRPPSSRCDPATHPGHGPCNASPPNEPG